MLRRCAALIVAAVVVCGGAEALAQHRALIVVIDRSKSMSELEHDISIGSGQDVPKIRTVFRLLRPEIEQTLDAAGENSFELVVIRFCNWVSKPEVIRGTREEVLNRVRQIEEWSNSRDPQYLDHYAPNGTTDIAAALDLASESLDAIFRQHGEGKVAIGLRLFTDGMQTEPFGASDAEKKRRLGAAEARFRQRWSALDQVAKSGGVHVFTWDIVHAPLQPRRGEEGESRVIDASKPASILQKLRLDADSPSLRADGRDLVATGVLSFELTGTVEEVAFEGSFLEVGPCTLAPNPDAPAPGFEVGVEAGRLTIRKLGGRSGVMQYPFLVRVPASDVQSTAPGARLLTLVAKPVKGVATDARAQFNVVGSQSAQAVLMLPSGNVECVDPPGGDFGDGFGWLVKGAAETRSIILQWSPIAGNVPLTWALTDEAIRLNIAAELLDHAGGALPSSFTLNDKAPSSGRGIFRVRLMGRELTRAGETPLIRLLPADPASPPMNLPTISAAVMVGPPVAQVRRVEGEMTRRLTQEASKVWVASIEPGVSTSGAEVAVQNQGQGTLFAGTVPIEPGAERIIKLPERPVAIFAAIPASVGTVGVRVSITGEGAGKPEPRLLLSDDGEINQSVEVVGTVRVIPHPTFSVELVGSESIRDGARTVLLGERSEFIVRFTGSRELAGCKILMPHEGVLRATEDVPIDWVLEPSLAGMALSSAGTAELRLYGTPRRAVERVPPLDLAFTLGGPPEGTTITEQVIQLPALRVVTGEMSLVSDPKYRSEFAGVSRLEVGKTKRFFLRLHAGDPVVAARARQSNGYLELAEVTGYILEFAETGTNRFPLNRLAAENTSIEIGVRPTAPHGQATLLVAGEVVGFPGALARTPLASPVAIQVYTIDGQAVQKSGVWPWVAGGAGLLLVLGLIVFRMKKPAAATVPPAAHAVERTADEPARSQIEHKPEPQQPSTVSAWATDPSEPPAKTPVDDPGFDH